MYGCVYEGCSEQGGKDERVTAVLLAGGMNLLQRKSQVINHSATMAEDLLRYVDAVGWLVVQNQATAHQMCSAMCVLPWSCTQPVTYHNCIAWGGLWEAERKARAQLTFFFLLFVLYPPTPHFPPPTPWCCILMRKYLVQAQAVIFGYQGWCWLPNLHFLTCQSCMGPLSLHCQHLRVHLKRILKTLTHVHESRY